MKYKIAIIIIFLIGAILRFWGLVHYPAGFNADEAALGYNAYSLYQTGKDEHGNILPINLESFGDFKPSLYSYLLVPLVKSFGLSEFIVRLPSAIFGLLSLILIFRFSYQLFSNKYVSLVSLLLLSISPWHIHFSRGAWEVNVSTTLTLFGMSLFIKWVNSLNFRDLLFSLLCFGLTLYTYQSARIISPMLGLSLVLIYKDTLFKNLKQFTNSLFILFLFLIPLITSLVFTQASSRATGVGLLADEGPVNFVRELRGQYPSSLNILGKILHNRPIIYSLQFIKNYLSHFEGNYLFVNGDQIQRNKVPETGLLYLSDIILIGFGLIYISTNIQSKFSIKIILSWLFISPLASSLTFQVPHALRSQNMVIPLTIILALGVIKLVEFIKNLKVRSLIIITFTFIYVWESSRYLHQYFIHYPQTYPAAWEYGFKEISRYVSENQNRYQNIIITNKYDQPYILLLFYLKYSPQEFQKQHVLSVRDKFNFSTVNEFSKYQFIDTNWDNVRDMHNSLIIASSEDIPDVGVNVVKSINFPNGQTAYKIISN